jgi:hypothetical protein
MPGHAGAPPDAGTIETIKHRTAFIGPRCKFDLRTALAGDAEP